jgi:hypothetical protein
MLTATAGEAVMAHRFKAIPPWKGTIPGRNKVYCYLVNKEKPLLILLINYKTEEVSLLILEKTFTHGSNYW